MDEAINYAQKLTMVESFKLHPIMLLVYPCYAHAHMFMSAKNVGVGLGLGLGFGLKNKERSKEDQRHY